VKLPRQRVQQLIEIGDGEPFAPAGRVFREWAMIPQPSREQWAALLNEAKRFAAGTGESSNGDHPSLVRKA
jgi:hypothetical protein